MRGPLATPTTAPPHPPHAPRRQVHWPVATVSQGNVTNNATISTDPACDYTHPATYNEKACRLSTWRAMVQIWQSGGAKAIGVSNYNVTHFTEIIDAGLPLPSVVQNPYHLYHSAMQADTIAFCRAHDILFLGYSPLGVPDYHLYPTTDAAGQPTGMSSSQLADPVVVDIATAIGRSPADVLLAWQWQQVRSRAPHAPPLPPSDCACGPARRTHSARREAALDAPPPPLPPVRVATRAGHPLQPAHDERGAHEGEPRRVRRHAVAVRDGAALRASAGQVRGRRQVV